MRTAEARRIAPSKPATHLYAFKRGDSTTLWCVPCRSSHWIILADPALREMTMAELRARGELEEGIA